MEYIALLLKKINKYVKYSIKLVINGQVVQISMSKEVKPVTKEDLYKALKEKFWNSNYIEIHSGDLDDILNVIINTINT